MILIGVVGLAFVVGIPYLLENSTSQLLLLDSQVLICPSLLALLTDS